MATELALTNSILELGSGTLRITLLSGGPYRAIARDAKPSLQDILSFGQQLTVSTTIAAGDGQKVFAVLDNAANNVSTKVSVQQLPPEGLPAPSKSISIPGQRISGLRGRLAGLPTGGAWGFTLTSSNVSVAAVVVAGIAFNASVQDIVAAIVAAAPTIFDITKNIGGAGGPVPNEFCIIFGGDQAESEWRVTAVTNTLSGGATPTPQLDTFINVIATSIPTAFGLDGGVLYDGKSTWTATSGTSVNAVDQIGGPDGNFAKLVQNAGGTMTASYTFTQPVALDMSKKSGEAWVYNYSASAVNVGWQFCPGAASSNWYTAIVPPGWSKITQDRTRNTGAASTGGDTKGITQVHFRIGSLAAEQQCEGAFNSGGTSSGTASIGIGISQVQKEHFEPGRIMLLFDDCRDTIYTNLYPLVKEFPFLKGKIGLGVIKNNVGAGGFCTLAQLQEMVASGWFYCFNHSTTHGGVSGYAFETGINTARTGGLDFIVKWKSGNAPTSGTYTLTFAAGTTAAIAYNADLKTFATAVRAVMPNAVISAEDTLSATISTSIGYRVSLQSYESLPTLTPTGSVAGNWDVGWGYTVEDIFQEYDQCRQYLINYGLSRNSSELHIAYPYGSFGRGVHAALVQLGARTGFVAGDYAGTPKFDTSMVRFQGLRLPRIDMTANAGVAAQLASVITGGDAACLMGHIVNASATNTSSLIKNQTELQSLFRWVERHIGTSLLLTTPMDEYAIAAAAYGAFTHSSWGAIAF